MSMEKLTKVSMWFFVVSGITFGSLFLINIWFDVQSRLLWKSISSSGIVFFITGILHATFKEMAKKTGQQTDSSDSHDSTY